MLSLTASKSCLFYGPLRTFLLLYICCPHTPSLIRTTFSTVVATTSRRLLKFLHVSLHISLRSPSVCGDVAIVGLLEVVSNEWKSWV